MKALFVVLLLALSALGESAASKPVAVTPVAGESWLTHLHRAFEETSMGKTGRLGPPDGADAEEIPDWQLQRTAANAKRTVHGSDLYRLNCQGCHGELGLGAPPEINSVINPTRAMSVQLVIARMKNAGMAMSRADAAQLANQSKVALLERLHKGGTDMPPFPHLDDAEVHAILAYLKQLAEVPGAQQQQVTVEESDVRIGEHVVKSTCHICHDAAGSNPDAVQLFQGMIPPLGTLTARTSLSRFEQKVRVGAPIMMGTPPSLFRGRMPVFYYLSEQEVADAYLYLKLYPPQSVLSDPVQQAGGLKKATSKIVPIDFNEGLTADPDYPRDVSTSFPIVLEVLVGLALAGGFWFTLREVRKSTALSTSRRVVLMVSGANGSAGARIESTGDKLVSRHDDYRRFESSWMSRWFEREDEAA